MNYAVLYLTYSGEKKVIEFTTDGAEIKRYFARKNILKVIRRKRKQGITPEEYFDEAAKKAGISAFLKNKPNDFFEINDIMRIKSAFSVEGILFDRELENLLCTTDYQLNGYFEDEWKKMFRYYSKYQTGI